MNAAGLPAQPQSIADLRLHMVQRFAQLLENQLRNQRFANAISTMVSDVHDDVMRHLDRALLSLQRMDLPAPERQVLLDGLQHALQRCNICKRHCLCWWKRASCAPWPTAPICAA